MRVRGRVFEEKAILRRIVAMLFGSLVSDKAFMSSLS